MKALPAIASPGAGGMAEVHAAVIIAAGGRIMRIFDPVTEATDALNSLRAVWLAETASDSRKYGKTGYMTHFDQAFDHA